MGQVGGGYDRPELLNKTNNPDHLNKECFYVNIHVYVTTNIDICTTFA